jgi:ABC-type transport system involved in cytochrome bd biosynthesis fused ATPase/permease subunit
MGFKKIKFGRIEFTKSKAQIRKEQKERMIQEITIYQKGLEEFFQQMTFEANKIHILRGNNGQGKSSLLKNIVRATSYNKINSEAGKIKFGSNDYDIAKFLTSKDDYSQFKFIPEDSLLSDTYDNTLSNVSNNMTLYTDFTKRKKESLAL